jgi:hypothetical protein
MPRLQQLCLVLVNHRDNATNLVCAEPAAFRDFDRIEPGLDRGFSPVDVNMRRLVRFRLKK